MRESTIEKGFVTRAKKLGYLSYKLITTHSVGLPDRMVLCPNGRVVFIEFKTPTGKTTPKQEYTHKLFRELGHEVYVCRSVEEGLACILNQAEMDI